jgi:hypothetical protein
MKEGVIVWAYELVREGREEKRLQMSAKIFLDSSTAWKTEIIQTDFSVKVSFSTPDITGMRI